MRKWVQVCVFAAFWQSFWHFSLAVCAETLSVAKLVQFLESSQPLIQQGKMTDKELAGFLVRVKLTERPGRAYPRRYPGPAETGRQDGAGA